MTAFVVRSFARAKKYIFIDDKEVEHSLEWFKMKQQANGCFPEYGTLFNKRLQVFERYSVDAPLHLVTLVILLIKIYVNRCQIKRKESGEKYLGYYNETA